MEATLNKSIDKKVGTNTINLDAKISEYENNHNNGKGKYFTLDEVNAMLDDAIKNGRRMA